ncbi:bifunctional adenosylcobinamide kinase/adenosylcobinamide-phosphate guanylyltransferase [Sedimentitalea nanhaiensis]|uniref:Bifunctional adenosylcobalamin biosynthesis protein n=1 Tax=Sedimentitalea nanhaiensis TaxID=999627 RepID=A0A1I6XH80_9RHOB|nr:bifunctional adenosylcobinamide kinase/adenosylcobinamide-phosphate guanylyltransferase [Sedimentitalea nanhaiensis]SFT37640.1 adenosylcobinamide kinase /adenosylcobinamide-phosphate guanylyltransferase [Sedimentitalea nanhaiensis]
MHPAVTLVLGGAASGKSDFAESLAVHSGKARVYLATAQAYDAEMRHKIDRHIARRGAGWTTVEAPLDLAPALQGLTGQQVCLLDCATMWLSNQMMAETDIGTAQAGFLSALDACQAQVIVVTNEVGQGVVPDNALARQFREAQGRLNIALATLADRVVQVTAGLPLALKGKLQ